MTDATKVKRGLGAVIIVGGALALLPSVQGAGIGLKKFGQMLIPTQQKIERGRLVYERQCVTCHGDKGLNDTPWAKENGLTGSLTDPNYKYGSGPIQIYNILSKKQEGIEHPVYSYVAYQDRWAVSHYVRSLSKTTAVDPPTVVAQAEQDAVNGVCREDVKKTIETTSKFQGEEQLKKGKEVYNANCVSCHGAEGKGQGAAAAGIQGKKPRNFVGAEYSQWTNGPSALAIFNTLANGIEGSSMAAYDSLPESERWAMAHYIRKEWIPESVKKESEKKASPEEEIIQTCRSLSAPAKPDPISVDKAMGFLVKDAASMRDLKRKGYGPVWRYPEANLEQGQQKFAQYCSSCHGVRGEGKNSNSVGPYGAVPPFLYLDVAALQGLDAGGSVESFATRSSEGVHSTLPDMTGATMMSKSEWKNIQLYVSSFEPKPEFIEAEMAKARAAMATVVMVKMTPEGEVMLGGTKVTPAELAQVMQSPAKQGFSVRIKADKATPQASVVAVMDALKKAGVQKMSLVTPQEPAAPEPQGVQTP